jgi:hypothetical protein
VSCGCAVESVTLILVAYLATQLVLFIALGRINKGMGDGELDTSFIINPTVGLPALRSRLPT